MPEAIQIQVIEARNLKSADLFSKSDPYAEITILGKMHSGKTERTKTVWNNNSPVWNESFTLYPESPNDVLRIQLFDKDVGTKDDYLGEIDVSLSRYYNKGLVDDWLPVTGKGGRNHLMSRTKGEIHIKVNYGKTAQSYGSGVAMPQPAPSHQPMAPSNPNYGGSKPGNATEYLGPANPAAAAALGNAKPSMTPAPSMGQQPPPYPGVGGNRTNAPSAPPASAPLYPPTQPPAQYSAPQPSSQYPPSTVWGPTPPPQQYPPVQYPPPTQAQYPPPMQQQYPPAMPQYPPMNQGGMYPPQNSYPPSAPTNFNPIPPFM